MLELNENTIVVKKNNIIKITKNKFVKEKSKKRNLKDNKEIIWNCSSGVINIFEKT